MPAGAPLRVCLGGGRGAWPTGEERSSTLPGGLQQAHYSILQQFMIHLVNEHLIMIRAECNGRSNDWIMREHKRRLTAWLKDLDLPDGETVDVQTIKILAAGLSSQVTSW